jgi:DNA end-binding protein Ku
MPPLRTGLLSFGLVSIPVTLHTATKSEHVSFHLLHAKCGSRIQNQYVCPVCNVVVERDDRMRGYELAKGEYVQFTEAELETLEAESSNNIDLKEFVPLSKIDPVYFDTAHYMGAGQGGEKPYRLLADALAKSKRAAIAQLVSRGKEELVLIRPYKNGLIMHSMYYANEVRDFGQIAKGEKRKALRPGAYSGRESDRADERGRVQAPKTMRTSTGFVFSPCSMKRPKAGKSNPYRLLNVVAR